MLSPLYCILIPALLAGGVWAVAWRVWQPRAAPAHGPAWAGALAVAAAFCACFMLLAGWPGFPPRFAEGSLPYAALAGLLITIIGALKGYAGLAPWVLLFLATGFMLSAPPRATWSQNVTMLWIVCGTAGSVALLYSLQRFAERHCGATIPLALTVWMGGSAAALGLTGSVSYAQFAASLAAAIGAGTVVSWINPKISFARGAVETAVLLNGGLLLCGYFYSDLPTSAALLLAAAPLLLWVAEGRWLERRPGWLRPVVSAACIALPVAAAVLIAAWPLFAAKAPGEQNYY